MNSDVEHLDNNDIIAYYIRFSRHDFSVPNQFQTYQDQNQDQKSDQLSLV